MLHPNQRSGLHSASSGVRASSQWRRRDVAAAATFASPESTARSASTSGSPVHIRVARRISREENEEQSSAAAPTPATPTASPATWNFDVLHRSPPSTSTSLSLASAVTGRLLTTSTSQVSLPRAPRVPFESKFPFPPPPFPQSPISPLFPLPPFPPQPPSRAADCSFAESLSDFALSGDALSATYKACPAVTLTSDAALLAGGALNPSAIVLTDRASSAGGGCAPLAFSASFAFAVASAKNGVAKAGQGVTFFVTANAAWEAGSDSGFLGWGETGDSPSFAVEFDTFKDPWDKVTPHIGFNLNASVQSVAASKAAITALKDAKIKYVWIDYTPMTKQLSVFLNTAKSRPAKNTFVTSFDPCALFKASQNDPNSDTPLYMGFSASTGAKYFSAHTLLGFDVTASAAPAQTGGGEGGAGGGGGAGGEGGGSSGGGNVTEGGGGGVSGGGNVTGGGGGGASGGGNVTGGGGGGAGGPSGDPTDPPNYFPSEYRPRVSAHRRSLSGKAARPAQRVAAHAEQMVPLRVRVAAEAERLVSDPSHYVQQTFKCVPPTPPHPTSARIGDRSLGGLPIPRNESRPMLNKWFHYASVSLKIQRSNNTANWALKEHSNVDWRANLSAVVDQDSPSLCSSCWAFAAASAIDGALLGYHINPPQRVSVQQMLTCGVDDCDGGFTTDAFEYAIANPLVSAAAYPYMANDSTTCNKSVIQASPGVAMVRFYERASLLGPIGLMLALQFQPVVVHVEADQDCFLNYNGTSILEDKTCFANRMVNHVVVLVGYHLEDQGQPGSYFILRNSWGTTWGDNGHMRIGFDRSPFGYCGMWSEPGYYPMLPAVPGKWCAGFPCGAGKCFDPPQQQQAPKPGEKPKQYSCDCTNQPFLIPAVNVDGTDTCIVKTVCMLQLQNPCGAGTCMDDGAGGYNCTCPANYTSTARPDGTATCIPPPLAATTYTIQAGDTCDTICAANNITTTDFQSMNAAIDCSTNLTAGVTVNVTSASAVKMCINYYTMQPNDTCASIATKFNLTSLTSINPTLDCTNITATQVCVEMGQALPPASVSTVCTEYYTLSATDTCASVQSAYSLTATELYRLNPGLNCNNLIDYSDSSLCVAQAKFGASSCSKRYTVKSGDTCAAIIYKYFRGKTSYVSKLNSGFVCTSSTLNVGLSLCVYNL
ncbi:unnamed protein product [Closterium sp. Naga37s-1]|nr:unnamed protein product [Closterium sp. Naga37s-1]